MSRFALVSLVVLVLATGCSSVKPPVLGGCSEGVLLDEKDCHKDGFEAADRCFHTKQAACDCLGCKPGRCKASDSKPADVACAAE